MKNKIEIYNQLAKQIVQSVTAIVGPVAVMLANQVDGLTASPYKVTIQGNSVKVIQDLLDRYTEIIGKSAITIAKKSTRDLLFKNKNLKIPKELK